MGKRLAGLVSLGVIGLTSLLGCDKTEDGIIMERDIPEGSKLVLTREIVIGNDHSRIEVINKEGDVICIIGYDDKIPDLIEYKEEGVIYSVYSRKGVVVEKK